MTSADRRLRLFLSSTGVDLAAFRDVVRHVCQRLGIDVLAMEEFGPDPPPACCVSSPSAAWARAR